MPVGRPYKCPYCRSEKTVSKGLRVTKGLGLRRLRRCKACGRKFTPMHQRPVARATPSEPGDQTAQASARPEEEPAAHGDVNVVL